MKELEIIEIFVWNQNTLILINQASEIFLLEIFKAEEVKEPSLKKEDQNIEIHQTKRKDIQLECPSGSNFLREICNEEVIKDF